MTATPTIEEQFKSAVREGDAERLESLLRSEPQSRALVNAPIFWFDAPALNIASSNGNLRMVDILLEHGADINGRSRWWAGSYGVLDCAEASIAEALIARGAVVDVHAAARFSHLDRLRELLEGDPGLVHARGGDGQTPLHFAGSIEAAAFLLDRGADIEAKDVDHESTPAQYMAADRPEVCRYLLSRGAKADAFMAVALDDLTLLRECIARDSECVKARTDRPPFKPLGSEAEHIYAYTLAPTPLHAAARLDRAECAALLLEHGADPMERAGYDEATPLHVAAWHNASRVVGILARAGADLDADSGPAHRNAPLGWAIVSGSAQAVEALLAHGAPIRGHYLQECERGRRGEFADFAPAKPEQYTDIAHLLRRHGA